MLFRSDINFEITGGIEEIQSLQIAAAQIAVISSAACGSEIQRILDLPLEEILPAKSVDAELESKDECEFNAPLVSNSHYRAENQHSGISRQ